MAKIKVVNKQTLAIETTYDADAPEQHKYGGPWGSPEMTVHLQVPDGLDPDCIEATTDANGDIVLQESTTLVQEKLQRTRNYKLFLLRQERDKRLKEADYMVNDLSLGLRSDTAAVSQYRSDLLSITDTYKDSTDPLVGLPTLDTFADDMSDFTWPAKP